MDQGSKKRIAKNTLMLYLRMALTMLVGLYTSRVVLNALGVADYGVFNVVGGVVTMLGFFSSSISTGTQRFLNVGMGRKDGKSLDVIFSTAINVHIIIGIITVLMLESAGVWFLQNKLVIPPGQEATAMWVFQCSVISFFISIISSPYNAAIVAHERMSIYAILSLLECVLKLIVAFCIASFGSNKLKLYASLLLVTAIIMRFAYSLYCRHAFKNIRYRAIWDGSLIRKMMSFSGWMIFGCLSDLLSTQGTNMLINIYFGPLLNAARAIGVQVKSAVTSFYLSFTVSVNPQITKSYASEDYRYCYNLVFSSTKLILYLMLMMVIPIALRSEQILTLWLKTLPPLTPIIVNLILIEALVRSTYGPLAQVCFASGKIGLYQLMITCLFITTFAGTYIFFDLGMSVLSTFILSIAIAVTGLFVRLYAVNREQKFPVWSYIRNVLLRIALASVIALALSYSINEVLSQDFLGLVLCTLTSMVFISIFMWTIGLDKAEREFVSIRIKSFYNNHISKR